jgi:hypothetical protein
MAAPANATGKKLVKGIPQRDSGQLEKCEVDPDAGPAVIG